MFFILYIYVLYVYFKFQEVFWRWKYLNNEFFRNELGIDVLGEIHVEVLILY